MSGIRFGVTAAAAVIGIALAGCSAMPSMPSWTPDWMQSKPPSAQMQPLNFQTCLTPCAVTVASEPQVVTITKIGFIPQTVQVTTGDPPDHSFWENPPPTLVPNPVRVVLQPVPPPPRPMHRRRPRGSAAQARTAARPAAPAQQPAASPFPPPPARQ